MCLPEPERPVEKEFVNPNLHVVLVHFPLALLVAGTAIELFSFLWRRHGFRAAGRWMILLGALSAVPTLFSGIYALHDVAQAQPLNDQQRELLADHIWLLSIATILAAIVVVTWLGSSDRLRSRLHWPLLAALLVSVCLSLAGAWHGGEAVFSQGVGVDRYETSPTTAPAITLVYFLPPMQMHVILAGTAVAIALAALGLSIRQITQGPPATQVDHIAAALGPPQTLIGANGTEILPTAPAPDPADPIGQHTPACRFWLLGALTAILTAAAGWWELAGNSHTWSFAELWRDVISNSVRLIAHSIVGGSIILLPLILAAAARWLPRQKWVLIVLAALLLIAVAAQIWLGILLLFDSPEGSLWKLK